MTTKRPTKTETKKTKFTMLLSERERSILDRAAKAEGRSAANFLRRVILTFAISFLVACGGNDFSTAETGGSGGMMQMAAAGMGGSGGQAPEPAIFCPHGRITVTGLPSTDLEFVSVVASAPWEPHTTPDGAGSMPVAVAWKLNGVQLDTWGSDIQDAASDSMTLAVMFESSAEVEPGSEISGSWERVWFNQQEPRPHEPIEITSCSLLLYGEVVDSWP